MNSPGKLSRRHFVGMTLGGLLLPSALPGEERGHPADLHTVCSRMVETDQWRTQNLLSYSVMRRYTLRHGESTNCAEMLAKVDYTYPGYKSFKVISEKNAGFLQERIFQRVIDAEIQASHDDLRDRTRILPRNYDFEVLGMEELRGRAAYVMKMRPKRKQRFLVNGKIWVDKNDAAVARVEGVIPTNTFWVHSFHMVQTYEKVGPYWLVASNRNNASVRFIGEAYLNIDYFDYEIHSA